MKTGDSTNIVLTGVSGAGKTTIGIQLAKALGFRFLDADDFHPAKNVEKMRNGIPLTDLDRLPWLEKLNTELSENSRVVLACSALKYAYRKILAEGNLLKFVVLNGDFDLISSRLTNRKNHFMNKSLLKSQFDTLEISKNDVVIDVSPPPTEIVKDIIEKLGLS